MARLSAATALFGAGCSPPGSTSDERVASRGEAPSGSLAAALERVRAERPAVSRRFTFPISSVAGVETLVRTYDEENGHISMTGKALDSEESEFMLKVSEGGLYGWLVYHDRNLAWEYETASDGSVRVHEVPLEKIFHVCPVPPKPEAAEGEDATDPEPQRSPPLPRARLQIPGLPEHVSGYPGDSVDVTKLESRPGSGSVFYIDLTDVLNGSEPRQGLTKEHLWETWSIAAAAHWQFDVNVTTDPAVYEAVGVSNSICAEIVWEDQGGSSSCGLNTFGSRNCCNNKLYNDGYATGRILNHEVGHGWGLGHDGGNDGGEYFNGFSDFQWTPLMGNVWPGDRWSEALFQWSKGEYTSATNTQDDFSIITRSVDYVEDDIPESTPLVLEGTEVSTESNWGHIGRNTDTDSWTFAVAAGGGRATLTIDRIEHRGGSMLDVHASILDSQGMTVAEDNASVARRAELDVDLPEGSYELIVEGGAEGTPNRGFSNYSSVGLYAISGTISNAVSGGTDGVGGTTAVGTGDSTTTGTTGAVSTAAGGATSTDGTSTVTTTTSLGSATSTTSTVASSTGTTSTMVTSASSTSAGTATTGLQGAGVDASTTSSTSTTGVVGSTTSTSGTGITGATTGGGVVPLAPPPLTDEGGCGCRLRPEGNKQTPLALGLLMLGALASRRRNRSDSL